LAVIEARHQVRVYLAGTSAEVEARTAELGGSHEDEWLWPGPLEGSVGLSLRLAPRLLPEILGHIPSSWSYQALPGVGEVRIGVRDFDAETLRALRRWVESRGGALVLTNAPAEVYDAFDAWGTAPPGLDLQRRLVARFDPDRIVNPGRLPGGL
ncbi:MAG: hypothetical protein OEY62_08840, partial [Acidimicrobiia bacterium]|nr:hypothetical protein [Acidimicrobiia bacterium]